MMRWFILILAVASAFAFSENARAEKTEIESIPPTHLYLAKGDTNACGEGCNTWIVFEGSFDRYTPKQIEAFLPNYEYEGLKLPIFFNSPGGSVPDAIAVGRRLRQLGVVTGVGVTIPLGCASASDNSASCTAAKYGPQPVLATLRPEGNCSSSCVLTLLGGIARLVPPSARVGIHAIKLILANESSGDHGQPPSPQQYASWYTRHHATMLAETRRYLSDMGIDPALLDKAEKVPHESVHYLSRDEIAGYGIDRREFLETPWLFTPVSMLGIGFVTKSIAEARESDREGTGRKSYRMSIIGFGCSKGPDAVIRYVHGLAGDELGRPMMAIASVGDHRAQLMLRNSNVRLGAFDDGAPFSAAMASHVPFDEIEAAARMGGIRLEINPVAGTSQTAPKDLAGTAMTVSTQGLAQSIKPLRNICASATHSDEARIPFAPAQTDDQTLSASPDEILPASGRLVDLWPFALGLFGTALALFTWITARRRASNARAMHIRDSEHNLQARAKAIREQWTRDQSR